ncbi:MAG: choice-of-anchor D domain-containing protein, partial [Nitriliruptorales bacterium]|nr:choice-of-anchor D domain-containing protein [Nitriliruptorales bacterium]
DNLAGTVDDNDSADVFVHDRIPVLDLQPNLNFGNVPVGTETPAMTVTAMNTGNGPLEFTSLALGGADLGDFRIIPALDGCTGQTLFAGDSCPIGLAFRPTAVGSRSATFTATGFTVTGLPPQATVNLVGTGVRPLLSITPDPVLFGPQRLGTRSGQQVVTVVSVGNVAVQIDSVAVEGGDAAAFPADTPGGDTCTGALLAPGASCNFTLQFEPTARGQQETQVVFRDNAVGNPHRVPVRGRGVRPSLIITPRPVDFGFGAARRQGEERTATVLNRGDAAATISDVAIAGTDPDDFVILPGGDNCTGETLLPDEGCDVQLRFTPQREGERKAVLRVAAADGVRTARAGLLGSAPKLRISPPLSRRGFVPQIKGRFFPPQRRLVLQWDPGLGDVRVKTDKDGRFATRLLVMQRDTLGQRRLIVRKLGFKLGRRFLVVPGSMQPPEFNARH